MGIVRAVKKIVMGINPQTLKLTQNTSDCVLQTISFKIAITIKKDTQQ